MNPRTGGSIYPFACPSASASCVEFTQAQPLAYFAREAFFSAFSRTQSFNPWNHHRPSSSAALWAPEHAQQLEVGLTGTVWSPIRRENVRRYAFAVDSHLNYSASLPPASGNRHGDLFLRFKLGGDNSQRMRWKIAPYEILSNSPSAKPSVLVCHQTFSHFRCASATLIRAELKASFRTFHSALAETMVGSATPRPEEK